MKTGVRVVFFVLLVVVGMGVGIILQSEARPGLGQALAPTATAQPAGGTVSAQEHLLRGIYTRINPSVVAIRVVIGVQGRTLRSDSGQGGQQVQMAAGSGFVYDTQGHIVTNAHVVQNTTQIEVTFSDGNIMIGKVTGIDLDSDLAVIQVQGDASHYAPVPLADSDQVQVGDTAIAIGNPFEEAGTMTQGIVSALHRTVQGLQTTASGAYSIPDAIQSDTPVNPGNSGGPLLNEDGQVIGVNEQIEAPAGQSSGVSFAISSNIVRQMVPTLIASGKVAHPYLGITTVSLDLDIDTSLKLPTTTRGALVLDVAQGSPAEAAKITPSQQTADQSQMPTGGDVITAIDDHPIQNSDDLIGYLFTKTTVGQTIKVTILRNGAQQTVSVTLAARPTTTAG